MKKNVRTFGHNYLKQWHFELFPKSGRCYSPRSYPGSGSGFFSEVGSGFGKNGPDPPTLLIMRIDPDSMPKSQKYGTLFIHNNASKIVMK
jgi:hypothetical protein